MDDYYFVEEFIFPEEGGATGMASVACPNCGESEEQIVELANVDGRLICPSCGKTFSMNWPDGTCCRIE